MWTRWLVCLTVAILAVAPSAPAAGPSENKGRRGTYECKTSRPLYNYFVYVPKSYSEENPAGIHLYFHGQGCQNTAEPYLKIWAKHFLEPCNLIGIDMQWLDGDNWSDTEGRAAAAMEAVQQVMADYKILRGRGVLASHSSGAATHGLFIEKFGRADAAPGTWFFNHSCAYGANYVRSVRKSARMSWFLCYSDGEWAPGGISTTQTDRAVELFDETREGRCPDIVLKVLKGQAHWKRFANGEERWIDDRDVIESARVFARSDLAFSPLLYAPDFPEPELAPVAQAANRLELGPAASALARMLDDKELSAPLRKKAEFIRAKIDAHVDALIGLAKELAADDPVLWGYYGKLFAKQLAGHPREDEFRKIPSVTPERQKDASWVLTTLAAKLGGLFEPTGKLSKDSVDVLRQIRLKAGEKSSIGRMVDGFLQFQ